MNRIFAPLCLCCATFLFASSAAAAVTISWVPVGDPGNAADQIYNFNNPDHLQFGALSYNYRIAKYDVTASQYAEFLNAKDPDGTNSLGLYNSDMSNATFGEINFAPGNTNGSKYSIISGRGNHPVNYVTWYDAIRFANWLNNGQGSGDTETGAYNLGPLGAGGIPVNGASITRNIGATVFLPSENEWYKAAYYNPATKTYFQYPTGSDTAPTAEVPPGGSNSANYNALGVYLTDVGAYTGTTSPCGAFDMGGNVWNWNEGLFSFGMSRGLRGGAFNINSLGLLSSYRTYNGPLPDSSDLGFRVANIPSGFVPEPSTGLLAIFACGLMWWERKAFRRGV